MDRALRGLGEGRWVAPCVGCEKVCGNTFVSTLRCRLCTCSAIYRSHTGSPQGDIGSLSSRSNEPQLLGNGIKCSALQVAIALSIWFELATKHIQLDTGCCCELHNRLKPLPSDPRPSTPGEICAPRTPTSCDTCLALAVKLWLNYLLSTVWQGRGWMPVYKRIIWPGCAAQSFLDDR